MITTTEATQSILEAISPFEATHVSLDEAAGRVLHQTVVAERDQPPFDRVTMDGIAIRFASFAEGLRAFNIQAAQYAGDPVITLNADANCIEIMTAAVLPTGTDCVIPVERIDTQEAIATIADDYLPIHLQFIHPQGSDYVKGHEILQAGEIISPAHIAIIASCGLDVVAVSEHPTVSVISTGNELVPAGEAIAAHQIRMSNGPALAAMLTQQGFTNVLQEHLPDDRDTLNTKLAVLLEKSNVLVLSGGVSMGKADFVPQVLKNLGVRLVFHKISQRPGKPMWFGIGPGGQAVFALPGNPVSSLVCCRQYVIPALLKASGRTEASRVYAVLGEDFSFKAALTCFLPVRIDSETDGRTIAIPVATNTSGDFSALGATDGYVELPLEQSVFRAGEVALLHLWDKP